MTDQSQQPPSDTPSNAPWYGEIPADRPQEFRDWIQNKGFKDPLSALESYHNAEKLLGAPADRIIRLPGPTDDAAAWEGVWNRLGRPEKPELYELEVPQGEKDDFAKFAATTFHKLGVPKSMAQQLVKEVNAYAAAQRQAYTEQLENEAKQQLDKLKAEWGPDFDKHAEFGKRGLAAYGKKAGLDDGDLAALENAIGTAKMLKLFATLGATTAEHDFGGGGESGVSLTPAQAKEKMDQLRQQRVENKISQSDYLQQMERLAPIAARAA